MCFNEKEKTSKYLDTTALGLEGRKCRFGFQLITAITGVLQKETLKKQFPLNVPLEKA